MSRLLIREQIYTFVLSLHAGAKYGAKAYQTERREGLWWQRTSLLRMTSTQPPRRREPRKFPTSPTCRTSARQCAAHPSCCSVSPGRTEAVWSVPGRSLPPPLSQCWRFEEQTNDGEHSGAELGEEDEDRQRGKNLCWLQGLQMYGGGTSSRNTLPTSQKMKKKKRKKKHQISAAPASSRSEGVNHHNKTLLHLQSRFKLRLWLQEVQFGSGQQNKHFVQSTMPIQRLDHWGVLHGAANCFQVRGPISFPLGLHIERPLHYKRTNNCCLLHTDYGTCRGNSQRWAHKRRPIQSLCPGGSSTDQLMNWASAPLTPSVCKARVQRVG